MYREIACSLADLRSAVLTMCDEKIPLGAYASRGRVRYLFLEREGVLGAGATAREGDTLRSVTADWPLFDWDEREMRDQYGILLEQHPDERPLFIEDGVVPEPLVAHGGGITLVVVGPVHAGVTEPGRFTFSTGGETVVHLDGQLSYSHRGIERFLEGRNVVEAAYYAARICGGCSVSRSFAYARAVEEICGIDVDEQADLARLVFAELERLYNHVFDLASAASGAGFGPGLTQGLGLKERILRLCSTVAGHRLLFDAIQPGGVREDTLCEPHTLRRELSHLRLDVERFVESLFQNRSVWSRFEKAGIIEQETARVFGAVGPARRASGGTLDVRTYAPYGAYRWMPVRCAHASRGDVAARCEVKRAELFESFRVIDDALNALGVAKQNPPKQCNPAEGVASTAVEGPRGTETISLECDDAGSITRLHAISSSYRNWPIVTRAMEGNIIPDFPLINKSFNLCYSCADR
jgi:Ni,Fe-hydrogenase III large subunit